MENPKVRESLDQLKSLGLAHGPREIIEGAVLEAQATIDRLLPGGCVVLVMPEREPT